MNRLWFGLATSIWAVLLWAALSLRNLPGDWGHFLCGPWGCGPPLQALLACHLSWLLVLLAPAAAIARSPGVADRTKNFTGWALILSGTGLLVAMVAYQLIFWRPSASTWQRHYLWQRCIFVLVTTVDAPAIQMIAAGSLLRSRPSGSRRQIGRQVSAVDVGRLRQLTIKVTQEDIDSGRRDRSLGCPVALAMTRAVGAHCRIDHESFRRLDQVGNNIDYRLPQRAIEFIKRFDRGDAVASFLFSVEVPDGFVLCSREDANTG